MKKAPIFVRELTDAERVELEAGLRSRDRFTLRRCQIILASARGEHAIPLGRVLGCTDETVRNAIKAFNAHGLAALTAGSHRPQTIERAFTDANAERLKDLLHHTPRQYGQPTSVWTLNLAAEVSFAEGLTAERVSGETIRATLKRLKVGWKRAKDWITSPDPAYARRKKRRDRLIQVVMGQPDWALGFQDETWWSRFAQPHLHTWVEKDQALKLVEKTPDPADPDPKASLVMACWSGLPFRTGRGTNNCGCGSLRATPTVP